MIGAAISKKSPAVLFINYPPPQQHRNFMYIGFSERNEPAIKVRIDGMDYALLHKEALIVADILEHVKKQAKLEGGSIDSMINGLRVSAEGARKNMAV
jgi:hypothetical protein